MAVRNAYSQAERLMLEAEAKRFDSMVGWYEPRRPMTAGEESIRRFGLGVDPWNPLWHDEVYARDSRWGAILAFPTYLAFFGETGIYSLKAPPECGRQCMIWVGEDWDFLEPVRPGDTLRVWQDRPQIFDVTPEDGPRTYGLIEGDLAHHNQDGRLVSRVRNHVQRTFLFDPPVSHPMPEYSYTREEIGYVGEMIRAETIRGRATRYWEDVRVGEELTPVVTGPTTMAINSLVPAIIPDLGDFFKHTRHFFLESLGDEPGPEFILDGETGRYLVRGGPMGRHYSDLAAQAEGEPCAWLFGVVSRFALLRLITNWMGDDGFIRHFKWRHMTRTRVGDTLIARARVVGKRVQEGEHLVDLHVWLRNLRGNVSEAALATVRLESNDLPTRRGAETVEQAVLPPTPALGQRVRIKARPEWPTPPGFRFGGAEGTVVKWVQYDEAMSDFSDSVVCVSLETVPGEGRVYSGSSLLFRVEDLESA